MWVKSKVGPQLNITGNQDATKWLLKGQPSVGVGIHTGVPGEYTQDIVWVNRIYENDFQPEFPEAGGYSRDPVQAAAQYAIKWYGPTLTRDKTIKFITTPNEPVVRNSEVMKWLAAFLAELIRIITVNYGCRAVVGNWSVGTPDFGMWLNYKPTLDAVIKYNAVLGRHSYGPLNEFYALRHRSDQRVFTSLGYPNLPVILTEAGWENLPEVGFRAWGTPPSRPASEYVNYLLELDRALWNDSYCWGASIFTYGLAWPQHNLNDSFVGSLFGDAVSIRVAWDLSLIPPSTQPTNQAVFNAVAKVAGRTGIGRMPHDLVQGMIQDRLAVYTGPDPRTWGLSEAERSGVAREMGLT